VTVPHERQSIGSFLYSNVRVRSVTPDTESGMLTLKVIYAEREEQRVIFDEVIYSQLGKNAEGRHILLAIELMPDEYRDAKHRTSAAQFLNDCKLKDLSSLEEIVKLGYRILTHYVGDQDEYVVVAKKLEIKS
jgi:hypothetical protein